MQESFEMMGFKGNISDVGIVQLKMKSDGGDRLTTGVLMTKIMFFGPDIALCEFVVL